MNISHTQKSIFSYLTTVIVNIGLKRSEFLNKLFVVISVAIMLFIVIAGAFRGNYIRK